MSHRGDGKDNKRRGHPVRRGDDPHKPTTTPSEQPPPPDGLKKSNAERIWGGKEDKPCLRCGEDHMLKSCTMTQPPSGGWKGRFWRGLSHKEVEPANNYVERLRPSLSGSTLTLRPTTAENTAGHLLKPPGSVPNLPGPTFTLRPATNHSTAGPVSKPPGTIPAVPVPTEGTYVTTTFDGMEMEKRRDRSEYGTSLRLGNVQKPDNETLLNRLKLVENSNLKNKKEPIFPVRNKLSMTEGSVITNHFEIRIKDSAVLHQYKIEPA